MECVSKRVIVSRRLLLLVVIVSVLSVNFLLHCIRPFEDNAQRMLRLDVQLQYSLPSVSALPRVGFSHLKHLWRNSSRLPRLVTKKEYDGFIRMLTDADRVLREWNITYMMSGGTMLGSYYHHDMVPWDDDADIVMEMRKMDLFHKAVESLGNLYRLYLMPGGRWLKLYRTDGRSIHSQEFRWPYVDVFLFLTDERNWLEFEMPDVLIPLDEIFPLSLRPFGPLWLPAPRNVPLYLKLTMRASDDERRCMSRSWDHINEKSLIHFTVPCQHLMDSYPFVVERRPASSPWLAVETVLIGNSTVQEVRLPENWCGVTQTF